MLQGIDLSILGYVTAFLFVLWLSREPHDMETCRHETWRDVDARIFAGGRYRRENNIIIVKSFKASN